MLRKTAHSLESKLHENSLSRKHFYRRTREWWNTLLQSRSEKQADRPGNETDQTTGSKVNFDCYVCIIWKSSEFCRCQHNMHTYPVAFIRIWCQGPVENWYIAIYVCVHLQCLWKCFQHPFVVCSLFLLARSCIAIIDIQLFSTLPHMCVKGMASRLCIRDSQ